MLKYFDFPKPNSLIKHFIALSTSPKQNDIILDFFAGSATTAHAVMQRNAEDDGNRKYIMVQLPEPCPADTAAAKAGYKTIADIAKERIRKADHKITQELEATGINHKPDLGFKVFKFSECLE